MTAAAKSRSQHEHFLKRTLIIVLCCFLVIYIASILNIRKYRSSAAAFPNEAPRPARRHGRIEPDWEEVQEARLKRVREVCRKYRLLPSSSSSSSSSSRDDNSEHFIKWPFQCNRKQCSVLANLKKRIALCYVPKAGYTTLSARMLQVEGVDGPGEAGFHREAESRFNPFSLLAKGTGDDAVRQLVKKSRLFFFSFVRHPFDRLVSAFENLVRPPDHPLGIGDEVGTHDNFTVFVDYVVRNMQNCTLYSCDVNVHWQPASVRCRFCSWPYAAVGKLETMARDERYIYGKIGLLDKIPGLNKEVRGNPTPWTEGRTAKHFAQVRADTVRKLRWLYRLDFEMFGYSAAQHSTAE